MGYGYYNGKFSELSKLKIPLSDRAIFFGDAVYDVAVGKEKNIYLLDEHIERLLKNAKLLGMPELPCFDEIERQVFDTIYNSRISEYILYLQLSRNLECRTHSAEKCKKTNLLITVTPFDLHSETKDARLILREDMRYRYCGIKTVNLLPAVIASSEAERDGYDECVFIKDGIITECAHSNISILKNGIFITHPTDGNILPGITLKHLLKHADKLNMPIEKRGFNKEELFSADEIFITSTTKGVRRVYEIEGESVGCKDTDIYTKLSLAYENEFKDFIKR